METLINRLKEVSTWQGIIAIIAAFGVNLSPEMSTGIITAAVSVIGLVSVIMKERGADDAK